MCFSVTFKRNHPGGLFLIGTGFHKCQMILMHSVCLSILLRLIVPLILILNVLTNYLLLIFLLPICHINTMIPIEVITVWSVQLGMQNCHILRHVCLKNFSPQTFLWDLYHFNLGCILLIDYVILQRIVFVITLFFL